MKRMLLFALVAGSLVAPARAGRLEEALENRWLGAWVVTNVETYSDCAALRTHNRVNGKLVSGRGRYRFKPGELAKVEKVDAKRSRLDLHLSLEEPLLAARQDGPFTLYDEVRCHMELEVELPRKLVSGDDVNGIEQLLAPVLARFAAADEAQQSRAWNRRKMQAYPKDYERTLAEHAAWRAEQTNALVQSRLDRSRDEAARVTERLNGDADYLAGLARGVEAARGVSPGGCSDLIARDPARAASQAPQNLVAQVTSKDRWGRGYQDGQILFFSLDGLRRLPSCFVPVPRLAEAGVPAPGSPPAGTPSRAARTP